MNIREQFSLWVRIIIVMAVFAAVIATSLWLIVGRIALDGPFILTAVACFVGCAAAGWVTNWLYRNE